MKNAFKIKLSVTGDKLSHLNYTSILQQIVSFVCILILGPASLLLWDIAGTSEGQYRLWKYVDDKTLTCCELYNTEHYQIIYLSFNKIILYLCVVFLFYWIFCGHFYYSVVFVFI